MAHPDGQDHTSNLLLPAEVEIYINPDGSVTFADLEASLVPVAESLEPGSTKLTTKPGEGSNVSTPRGG